MSSPLESSKDRDHGGGVDAAVLKWGGQRCDWLDLSTGINPVPYNMPPITVADWAELPDKSAQSALIQSARNFWQVPENAHILAAPGASALIAKLPSLAKIGRVDIPAPTYSEHAAAFAAGGWTEAKINADARVLVHPNNPTGQFWTTKDLNAPFTIVDESFCDIAPNQSLIASTAKPGRIVLKSFGKFWGLAGLRLGFAIGAPELIERLGAMIGPWAVSGPALRVGTAALSDQDWATATRARLKDDAARLDALLMAQGATLVGGTSLFRLYEVENAARWQDKLAQGHVWSRIFPYSRTFLRLGLPAPNRWDQLEAAL